MGINIDIFPPGDGQLPGSIQKALDAAQPGMRIHIHAGCYRERLVLSRGGTAAAPLVIDADPGVEFDASTYTIARGAAWRPSSLGADISTIAVAKGFEPGGSLTIDGQTVPMLRWDPTFSTLPDWYLQAGLWFWKRLMREGVYAGTNDSPDSVPNGYLGVRALAIYNPNGTLYLKVTDGVRTLPPGEFEVKLADRRSTGVKIAASNVVLRGLTIRHAYRAIDVTNCRNVTIELNSIRSAHFGVRLWQGCQDITIRSNYYSMDQYSDTSTADLADDLYMLRKNAGFVDVYGIEISSSIGNITVCDNLVEDGFAGIVSGWQRSFAEEARYNNGVEVTRNRIGGQIAGAMRVRANATNHHWHHNVVENCKIGMRIWEIATGALDVHHNLILDGPLTRMSIMVFRNPSESLAPVGGVVYLYNNTMRDPKRLFPTDQRATFFFNNTGPLRAADMYVYGNLVLGTRLMRIEGSTETSRNWVGTHNGFAYLADPFAGAPDGLFLDRADHEAAEPGSVWLTTSEATAAVESVNDGDMTLIGETLAAAVDPCRAILPPGCPTPDHHLGALPLGVPYEQLLSSVGRG